MRRWFSFIGLAAIVLPFAGAADGACRIQTAVVTDSVVAVPVAVSLGVPVAAVAPYYYSYSQFSPNVGIPAVDVEAIATRVVEKLRASEPAKAPDTLDAPPPLPMVAQKCLQCHGGTSPKAGLGLDNLASLSCETKLKAVRAVLTEKMPKDGPPLTPEEAGKVLEELTK